MTLNGVFEAAVRLRMLPLTRYFLTSGMVLTGEKSVAGLWALAGDKNSCHNNRSVTLDHVISSGFDCVFHENIDVR